MTRGTYRSRTLMLAGTALVSVAASFAFAGPNGGTVVGGSGTISGQGSSSVTVNQSSQNLIVNWATFNIGKGETTTFNQPNSTSIALNRVIGGMGPSFIDGTLTANGRVFIVNGDGILIGPNGSINTSGFLATTHDIRNEDFMAGKYNFTIPGNPNASVVNLGNITATSGGFAALVAPGVRNSGTITATLGTVSLAAGNGFTLDFYGDKLITLAVGDQIASQVIDVATGKPLKSLISNDGKLSANGGRVELTAAAARAVVDSVINNTGVIEANSVGTKNGLIVLSAATAKSKPAGAPTQTVKLSGTISASGKTKGSTGGTVAVSGENIVLAGANIDVSGDAGGGHVLIGGDTGGGTLSGAAATMELAKLESFVIPTASTVTMDGASTINASATGSGNGGKVVLWSDQQTTFAGTILAQGGPNGGNGGFVETSSHGILNFAGAQVNTSAPMGATGIWLLDPSVDLNIDAAAAATISSNLATTSVLVQMNGDGSITGPGTAVANGDGDISVNASISWSSNNTLTLSAYDTLFIGSGVVIANTASKDNPSPSGNLVLRADNTGTGGGSVYFGEGGKIDFSQSTGAVSIYYNPGTVCEGCTKYQQHSDDYAANVTTNVNVSNQLTAYMLVNSADDLTLMGQNLGQNPVITGNFALGRDIILNADGNSFAGFAPGTTFNGLFTGNGGLGVNYKIANLSLQASSDNPDSYGLFPFVGQQGTVRDLILQDASITAGHDIQSIGLLAGQNAGTIINVSVVNSGEEGGSFVDGGAFAGISAGGLVGTNAGGTIINSSSAAQVTVGDGGGCTGNSCGPLNFVGGLVGDNITILMGGNCDCAISASSSQIVGTITGSSATGNVSGGANSIIGGLVGENIGAIMLSSASGNVTLTTNASSNSTNSNTNFAGGLVGQNGNGGAPPNVGTIASSFAIGNVTGIGLGLTVGGLVGDNSAGSLITDSQAFGNVTANSNGTAGSQFSNSVTAGGLVGFNQGIVGGSTAPPLPGENSSDSVQVAAIGDVSLISLTGCSAGAHFSCAIGNVTVGALGQGGGLVGNNDGALFNVFAIGSVTGAAGLPPDSSGNNNQTQLGGLVGVNTGLIATAPNTIAYAKGDVGTTGVAYLEVGGFVAENHGSIGNSKAYGSVSAGDNSTAGGFVGSISRSNDNCGGCTVGIYHNNSATIFASSASGNVSVGKTGFAGGFGGTSNGGFEQVTASGSVSGGANSVLGGLLGGLGASVTSVVFQSSTSSTSTVTSTGANSTVGGLVGLNGGLIDSSQASGPVTGTSFSYLGGLVGINVGSVHSSSSIGAVTGTGTNNVVGGDVGQNLGLIDPTTSSGNASSGADSFVGAFAGANSAFNNFSPGQLPPSSFPFGSICTDCLGSGSVNGGAGPQIGINFPVASSGLPSLPGSINNCGDAVCNVLVQGILFDPNAINQPPLPPLPLPPLPPSPTTEAQLIQNLIFNVTQVSVTLGEVVSTQSLNQPLVAPPPPGPGGLPPEFGPRFFVLPPPGTQYVKDELVLQVPNNVPLATLQSVLASLGLSIMSSTPLGLLGVTTFQVHIDNGQAMAAVMAGLAGKGIIAGAQANYTWQLTQDQKPQDPEPDLAGLTQGEGDAGQYTIGKLGLVDVHRQLKGSNISIAVIDSQIDVKHPDLEGDIAEQFDAVGAPDQPHAHGTGMAGAIASHRRLMGIAPSARIYAVHAFSSGAASAESTTFNILKGLEWAAEKGVRVINMSFAGPRDPSMERALRSAHDKGIVLIAAAGNAGPKSPPLYPGADPNVIAVTATDVNDKIFTGANRGKYIAVAAPGVDILVPAPDNTYQLTTGTSVASAEVSGVAALLLERNPGLGPEDIRKILTASAHRLGKGDRDDDFGSGLVDPSKAIQTAADYKAVDVATGAVPARPAPVKPMGAPMPARSPGLTSTHSSPAVRPPLTH